MIAYLDVRGGASGTSLLSACLDAAGDVDEVGARLGSVLGPERKIRLEERIVGGLRTSRIHVDDADGRIAEDPGAFLARVAASGLPASVTDRTTDVYRRMIAAEARVHGVEPDAVRFEELATVRSVVGVVGTLLALAQLEIDEVVSSPVPFGGGTAETHHGRLPLPAPATLELLRGVRVEPQPDRGELVTPTGAALLVSLASDFGEIPATTIQAIGVGSAQAGGTPIVTRVVIGNR